MHEEHPDILEQWKAEEVIMTEKETIHVVKIDEVYADAIMSGEKTFEIRKNDRGYQKGDILQFECLRMTTALAIRCSHPINDRSFRITYVQSGYHLDPGYVVLAIKEVVVV